MILAYTGQYLKSDVTEWIFKKCFKGSKSDYWDILNITTSLFYSYLFRTDDQKNYKNFCKWFLKTPLYICTSDKTINDFEGITEWKREQLYKDHSKNLIYEKLYNKVLEVEDIEIKENFYIFFIICEY